MSSDVMRHIRDKLYVLAVTVNEYLKGNRNRKRRKHADSSICGLRSAIYSISMIQTHERFKTTVFIRTKQYAN